MCRVIFPSSFSPRKNGEKKQFLPRIINASASVFFNMVISDTKGNVVYETYSAESPWDGTFRGKLCPKGEYLYSASILESDKDPSAQLQRSGTISLE